MCTRIVHPRLSSCDDGWAAAAPCPARRLLFFVFLCESPSPARRTTPPSLLDLSRRPPQHEATNPSPLFLPCVCVLVAAFGKAAGVGAAANTGGVGRGVRLAGRSCRSTKAGSAVEGTLAGRSNRSNCSSCWSAHASPKPRLLCCGPHAREGQMCRRWWRVQRPPPPLLFESCKPSRECIVPSTTVKHQIVIPYQRGQYSFEGLIIIRPEYLAGCRNENTYEIT